jgi:polysaccharide export outer membrane protein
MSLRQRLLWPFVIALVAGCKGPSPAVRPLTDIQPPTANRAVVNLPAAAFTSFPLTNGVPSEWLKPPTEPFLIGPGDVLEIEILGEAGSLATASVGPDGKIYYSLLPGTLVWGLSLLQTKEVLESQLGRYLRVRPEVAVTLKEVGSRRVWILGNVAQPGVYPMGVPMTLLEAISFAGGPIINNLENSFVIRNGQRLPVDFQKLFRGGDLSHNIYLQPGDFVYLQSPRSEAIYVLGAVVLPNAVPYSEGISLASAIAYGGGPAPYAAMSQVAIIRGSLTQPSIATVNFNRIVNGELADIQLQPGDLVYVPRTTFYILEYFLNTALDILVRTVAVNEGRNAVFPDARPVESSIAIIPP